MIVLGISGVGKTCIINKYSTNSVKLNQSATMGVEYTNKTILWDDLKSSSTSGDGVL